MDLYEACQGGKLTEVMSILAVRPGLMNSHSPAGFTPLGIACVSEHEELADFLLRHGALTDVVSADGLKQTPLHYTAINGNIDILLLLLRRHADKNIRDSKGKTALDYAKEYGMTEAAELLTC